MAAYQPLQEKTAVQQFNDWVSKFGFDPSSDPDGLTVTAPEQAGPLDYADMPHLLRTWLYGLRVLRGVPLTHLVPDPALLPPESIRFFHVDPTWVDRLVDGALSVASIGTSDFTFSAAMLTLIRTKLDKTLEQVVVDQNPSSGWKAGKDPMTGMLIRSELVRRWPELVVRAERKQGKVREDLGILRKEPVSRDVMIALFAGSPTHVMVREPDVAMRFGVEGPKNLVNLRDFDGEFIKNGNDFVDLKIPFRDKDLRVLKIADIVPGLQANAWKSGLPGRTPGSRDIAINLEQLPYVQVFHSGVDEESGSKGGRQFGLVQGKPAIQLRKGRFVHVDTILGKRNLVLKAEDGD